MLESRIRRVRFTARRRAALALVVGSTFALLATGTGAQALLGLPGPRSTPTPSQQAGTAPAPTPCPSPAPSTTPDAQVPTTTAVPGNGVALNLAAPGPLKPVTFNGAEGGFATTWSYYQTHALQCGAVPAISSLNLGFVRCCQPVNVRYCYGSSDCTYHFANGLGMNARTNPLGPDQLMNVLANTTNGALPMMLINLEAGTIQEAANFVAYMNYPADPSSPLGLVDSAPVHWANLRASNGHPAPYGVRYWELGNEEYAIASLSLKDYGTCTTQKKDSAQLYGCLSRDYARAMKAVDPTISVVANYSADAVKPVLDDAGSMISAFDYHAYSPEADSYSITFDHDMQSTNITVNPVANGLTPTRVTYAFWLTGSDFKSALAPVINVFMDGSTTPLTTLNGDSMLSQSKRASTDSNASSAGLLVAQVLTSPGPHTMTLVACSGASASMAPGSNCADQGRDFTLTLRKISYTLAAGPSNPYSWFTHQIDSRGCFYQVPGNLVETRTGTSQRPTDGNPYVPWRSSPADYAVSASAGYAGYQHQLLQGGDPWYVRGSLQTYNAQAATPWNGQLIVGEYTTFPGCDELPYNIINTHEGAMGDALMEMNLLRDNLAAPFPVVASSLFAADTSQGSSCRGWQAVHEAEFCTQGNTGAYLGAQGQLMRLLWSLKGNYVPTTVSSPKLDVPKASYQAAYVGADAVDQVQCVAYVQGKTLQVALANLAPNAAIRLPVSLAGGSALSASAVTIAAAPEASNTDSNRTAVAPAKLPVQLVGGVPTVTLPAFSLSLVTITLA